MMRIIAHDKSERRKTLSIVIGKKFEQGGTTFVNFL
jgi:hypothetical protein